jgi:hypothetical protein
MTQDIESGIIARFRVEGRPRSKGSLNVYCMRNRAHTVRVEEQVAASKSWRQRIVQTIRSEYSTVVPYPGAVEIRSTFFFERELDATGAHFKDTHMEDWPIAPEFGDEDKLSRNLRDAIALNRAGKRDSLCVGLIVDDRQIVRSVSEKRWAALGSPASMQVFVLRCDNVIDMPLTWGQW